MSIWLLIIGLVIKYGPILFELLKDILDLIKAMKEPHRTVHMIRYRGILKRMYDSKPSQIQVSSELLLYKQELEQILR